jgi:arabinose-5-phosphate isomerase
MSIKQAKEVLQIEVEGILHLINNLGNEFNKAIELLMNCNSRVIISGIGKSGIIGQKIAATLNSTGTSSFFLHPVEAMHGDLGMVSEKDIILAISNSGETAELNMLLPPVKKKGNKIIAMTGGMDSTLATIADIVLNIGVPREACPLGLAPTASTTATLALGDALSVVLLEKKNFKESDFRKNHPGGSLGERLKIKVSEVMLKNNQIPQVPEKTSLKKAINTLNKKNQGAVLIIDDSGFISGILTDGDIRRLITRDADFDQLNLIDAMTVNPKRIREDLLAADALSIMQRHEVTILPVIGENDKLSGMLHLHDLLGKGEFRFLV